MPGTAEGAAKARAKGKTKGRTKGSKNKFTNLKDSFLKAYEAEDGFGGDKKLKKFAQTNPDTFLNMITKLLPKQLDASLDLKGNPPTVNVTFSNDKK